MTTDSAKNGITDYLSGKPTDKIPPEVRALAGIANFAVLDPIKRSKQGQEWIKRYFNDTETEDQIVERLKKIPPPQTYSIGEISDSVQVDKKKKKSKRPTFTIVEGVDTTSLQDAPLGKESVVQVASQFNFLESQSAKISSVQSYIMDWTQGPAACFQGVAAAIHRRAGMEYATDSGMKHALEDVLTDDAKNTQAYKDGYLKLTYLNDQQKMDLLKQLQENRRAIRVLPQWVQCEKEKSATQLQVFCAAPSFQGLEPPKKGTLDAKICEELVVAQYIAIAQLAVIRSRETGQNVPLHLTLVGQASFKNPPYIMEKAMKEVEKVVKGENVSVYVHAYNNAKKTKAQLKGVKTTIITAEQFNRLQPPSLTQPHEEKAKSKGPLSSLKINLIKPLKVLRGKKKDTTETSVISAPTSPTSKDTLKGTHVEQGEGKPKAPDVPPVVESQLQAKQPSPQTLEKRAHLQRQKRVLFDEATVSELRKQLKTETDIKKTEATHSEKSQTGPKDQQRPILPPPPESLGQPPPPPPKEKHPGDTPPVDVVPQNPETKFVSRKEQSDGHPKGEEPKRSPPRTVAALYEELQRRAKEEQEQKQKEQREQKQQQVKDEIGGGKSRFKPGGSGQES